MGGHINSHNTLPTWQSIFCFGQKHKNPPFELGTVVAWELQVGLMEGMSWKQITYHVYVRIHEVNNRQMQRSLLTMGVILSILFTIDSDLNAEISSFKIIYS